MIKANLVKAYNFAEDAHKGQVRKFSGLPYFTHSKGVARIIEELTGDEVLTIASLLHDTLEDTKVTERDLYNTFRCEVVELVKELTSDDAQIKKLSKKVYLGLKMVNMSDDALLIKLADRFHNILYLQGDEVSLKFIEKYYKETRFIMSYLKAERVPLEDKHYILIGKIEAILDFLQIRHNL